MPFVREKGEAAIPLSVPFMSHFINDSGRQGKGKEKGR
jgi:hypothetical protein